MKRSHRAVLRLRTGKALGVAALMFAGACGQKPSFHDSETVSRRTTSAQSADALPDEQVILGPNGEQITVGEGGSKTVTNPDGSKDPYVDPTTVPTEPTSGDKEPPLEGPGSGGDPTTPPPGDDVGTIPDTGGKEPGEPSTTPPGGEDGSIDLPPPPPGGELPPPNPPDPSDPSDPGDPGVPPEGTKKQTREMSFPTQVVDEGSIVQNLANSHVSSSLTMQRLYTQKTKQVQQIVRPTSIDAFEQGFSGDRAVEHFAQVADRPVDILVVIDNSASMVDEQKNLAAKMAPLLSYIADANWRIGIVTTDPADPCLRTLINKGDANAAAKFAAGINAGIKGSSNERGVLTSVRSLKGECLATPWIRPDSQLSILVVTDEDNCSAASKADGSGENQNNCPGKDYAKGSYLLDYLAQIRLPGKTSRVYGIFWHPSQTKSQCPTGYNQAVIWSKLVEDTQGTWGSICDADYSTTLSKVSKDISLALNDRFTLKTMPELNSVEVFVNDVALTSGVTVNGKIVEVSPPPPQGSRIRIAYKYGATPMRTGFALRFRPVADKLIVTINDQLVPASDYRLLADIPAIEFNQLPPDRARIVVTYVRDVPLTQQFLLSDQVRPASLAVTVNGVTTKDYTVIEALGLISFTLPPVEAATIVFSYTAIGGAVTRYPFTPLYDPPSDLTVIDAETLGAVPFTYAAGALSFPEDEFVEGRELVIRYENPMRQKFTVTLPHEPMAGTVVAQGGGIVCSTGLLVNGRDVTFTACGFAESTAEVRITYKYALSPITSFSFDMNDLPAAGAWQEWQVYVDGVETKDFQRVGHVIHFATSLPLGSVVTVRLTQYVKS